jgi:hypothetical protein
MHPFVRKNRANLLGGNAQWKQGKAPAQGVTKEICGSAHQVAQFTV